MTAVEGDFPAGSCVRVLSEGGREIARGLVNFEAVALQRIIGHRTEDFARLLPNEHAGTIPDEVIHRDNLVLMM